MRYFVAGSKRTWDWQGQCVVDPARPNYYKYLPNAPKESEASDWIALPIGLGVDELLCLNQWVEVTPDPDLAMDEGL